MDHLWLTLRGVSPSIWSHGIDLSPKAIGRKSFCEIQLLHQSVSRKHAETWCDESGVAFIRDLGSSNGTSMNGIRVREAEVVVGDILQLGQVMLDVCSKLEDDGEPDILLNRTTELRDTVAAMETIDVTMASLSEAQLRVLRLLLTAQSEKQIAESLFISPHTVHSHVKQIYQYYDVKSRPALMAHFIDLAALDERQSE